MGAYLTGGNIAGVLKDITVTTKMYELVIIRDSVLLIKKNVVN